jgi:hypothetical protein
MRRTWTGTILNVFACSTASCIFLLSPAIGKAQFCSAKQAVLAATEAETLTDWKKVHAFYSEFAACDDGEVADLFSEAVLNLLTKHWVEINVLMSEIKKDQPFQEFVLNHVDSTADTEDLKRVRANATNHCPKEESSLCAAIAKTADEALK